MGGGKSQQKVDLKEVKEKQALLKVAAAAWGSCVPDGGRIQTAEGLPHC